MKKNPTFWFRLFDNYVKSVINSVMIIHQKYQIFGDA